MDLTNFRKYLGEEVLGKVNEAVVAKLERLQENQQQEDEPDPPKRGSGHKDQTMPERVAVDEHGEEESRSIAEKEIPSEEDSEPAPAGKLVVDATCIQPTLLTRLMYDCFTGPACRVKP